MLVLVETLRSFFTMLTLVETLRSFFTMLMLVETLRSFFTMLTLTTYNEPSPGTVKFREDDSSNHYT